MNVPTQKPNYHHDQDFERETIQSLRTWLRVWLACGCDTCGRPERVIEDERHPKVRAVCEYARRSLEGRLPRSKNKHEWGAWDGPLVRFACEQPLCHGVLNSVLKKYPPFVERLAERWVLVAGERGGVGIVRHWLGSVGNFPRCRPHVVTKHIDSNLLVTAVQASRASNWEASWACMALLRDRDEGRIDKALFVLDHCDTLFEESMVNNYCRVWSSTKSMKVMQHPRFCAEDLIPSIQFLSLR
jgi:hypothetical protein